MWRWAPCTGLSSALPRKGWTGLARASAMEEDLIRLMQEQAPDQAVGETQPLHLRQTSQYLKDRGHQYALPLLVQRSPRSIAADGLEESQGTANMRMPNFTASTS